jgi:nucleotide-binding universal stress UspA family protein
MKADVILCPVDFSEASHHAVRYAAALAAATGARVVGLHVHQPALAAIPAGVGRDDPVVETMAMASPGMQQRLVAQFDQPVLAAASVTAELAAGTPAEAIAERALTAHADVVVIGTRGSGGLQHLLLGSVTEEVMRKSTAPVLAIPPRAAVAPTLPFARVLFAIDFSAASLVAMDAGLRLLGDAAACATVLHVIGDAAEHELFVARPYDVHHHADALERHVLDSLTQVTRERFAGGTPALRLSHGRAAQEILAVAADLRADLIVMGVHGRNALDLAIFGSTTNDVVRQAPCPVLTARR